MFAFAQLATRVLFTLIFAFTFALAVPQMAHAQTTPWTGNCVESVTFKSDNPDIEDREVTVATIQGFECLIANVLSSVTTIIGLAAFVMLIIASFLYLTSSGNSKGTEAAKQTMTYAIIGIIVALMSFFILQLISDFTGVRGFLRFDLSIEQSE